MQDKQAECGPSYPIDLPLSMHEGLAARAFFAIVPCVVPYHTARRTVPHSYGPPYLMLFQLLMLGDIMTIAGRAFGAVKTVP